MPRSGLTRVPYYPELECLKRTPEDRLSSVLSLLLYWHTLPGHQPFNERRHACQLACDLHLPPAQIRDIISYLQEIGVLSLTQHSFIIRKDSPEPKLKTDNLLSLNFRALQTQLAQAGVQIPLRVLTQAAYDHADFYTHLTLHALPLVQGITGELRGEEYERTCHCIATLLCSLCSDSETENFARQAISPAWLMLLQPPVKPEEIASRWLREQERAVDLDLTDGAFFLPDADCFGTRQPHLWHCGKRTEPRILAAALYLCPTAISGQVHFVSDLAKEEIARALCLLWSRTGLKGRLAEEFFAYRELTQSERLEFEQYCESALENVAEGQTQVPKTDFH